MKMVLCPAVDRTRLTKIRTAAGEMEVVNAPDEASAAPAMVEAEAFFGKLTPSLLAEARRLRWVQSPTASLEHYLFPELIAHPCTLTNMRGLFSDVIADHVFGYILCFARNFHTYLRQQLRREWHAVGGEDARPTFAIGPASISTVDRAHLHLGDCTLGIIGLGSIGQEIARRANAFHMRVLAVDPVVEPAPEGVEAVWKPERLGELLASSDFVVIAAPHTPDTEKLFRAAQFGWMKPTAFLINIGRGAIVDLADLTAALERKVIAGAGLDVFETEPLPADHPLWAMQNVMITPHVAGHSVRIAERHLATLLDNIQRFVSGRPLVNVVDKERWC